MEKSIQDRIVGRKWSDTTCVQEQSKERCNLKRFVRVRNTHAKSAETRGRKNKRETDGLQIQPQEEDDCVSTKLRQCYNYVQNLRFLKPQSSNSGVHCNKLNHYVNPRVTRIEYAGAFNTF